jgi:hypothetical protein
LTSDGKQGHETYPHGGLFPEEVIIPWLVFERDVAEPKIIAELDGNGEAGKTGALHITIRNLSDLHLMIMSVHLSDKAQKDGEWAILPCSTCEHTISIQPWPSKSEAAHISVQLLIRRLDGRTFEQIVVPNLTVTEMYSRDDSLLKDLEL